MHIVTYEYVFIGNSTRDHRLYTTLIDIPVIDWWVEQMRKNDKYAKAHENNGQMNGPGYYKTTALVFAQEIADGEYPDIEWYPTHPKDGGKN